MGVGVVRWKQLQLEVDSSGGDAPFLPDQQEPKPKPKAKAEQAKIEDRRQKAKQRQGRKQSYLVLRLH